MWQHIAAPLPYNQTILAKSNKRRFFLGVFSMCLCCSLVFKTIRHLLSFYCCHSILFSCFITLGQVYMEPQFQKMHKKNGNKKTLYICSTINYISMPKRVKYLNGESYCFCCSAAFAAPTTDGNSADREKYPYGRLV